MGKEGKLKRGGGVLEEPGGRRRERTAEEASETGVIDSMLPSVAPFRRDRSSNKARLTTLFYKGYMLIPLSSMPPFHLSLHCSPESQVLSQPSLVSHHYNNSTAQKVCRI